jgi:hypothetical protein
MNNKRARGTTDSTPSLSVDGPSCLSVYRPDAVWVDACDSVVEIFSEILRHTVGMNWRIVPQGSFVQGLQIKGSDLDLVLLDGTDRWKTLNRRRNADELERVVRHLTRAQWDDSRFPIRISVVQKIYSARVPLVKLRVTVQSSRQQVMVDMCFGDPSRGRCDEFVASAISDDRRCENFLLAIKIWSNKRGMCETHHGGISCFAVILLALFHYKLHSIDWLGFFEFFLSLKQKSTKTVCLETLRIIPRPENGYTDFLHVSVPCRASENAARCTRSTIWTKTIAPELQRAIRLVKTHKLYKGSDFEKVVSVLLDGPTVWVSDDSDDSSEVEVVKRRKIEEESEPPITTPVAIVECDMCNYFSFNTDAMTQHKSRVHRNR